MLLALKPVDCIFGGGSGSARRFDYESKQQASRNGGGGQKLSVRLLKVCIRDTYNLVTDPSAFIDDGIRYASSECTWAE